jgi:NAD(P)H-dependent flavin oxidoreductase YrpB (nitropropane dioxygenase family)
MSLVERIGVEHPVVQAGMGGGIAGATLAGAVSAAGGLGTVGILPPAAFAPALHEAKRRAGAGRPVAANLLVPFTRRPHVLACIDARVDVVVLHARRGVGIIRELRAAGIEVLQTVGTADEARQAVSDGATGLVVQGVQAGSSRWAPDGRDHALRGRMAHASPRVGQSCGGAVG